MESFEVKIKNINDAFELYRALISDESLCEKNQKIISNLACQIDAYALATIVNFYNKFTELAKNAELWKANLFVIRMLALITTESIKYLDKGPFN